MIRDQKFLLPPHEHVFPVRAVLVVKVGLFCLFGQGPPGGEAGPVLHVLFVAGAPVFVPGLEGIFGADDLAFEKGGQGRVFGCEACGGLAMPGPMERCCNLPSILR